MERVTENVIEFIEGDEYMWITASKNSELKKKIKAMMKKDNTLEFRTNKDGSMYGKMPISYLSFKIPKNMSDNSLTNLHKG